tara:strand:- start:528 stop:1466 length:939 start_codon:yes stop_codon:yes gene_type:complete
MYQNNINETIAPASLTKIMTAIILLDHYDINDTIEVSVTKNDIKGKIAYIQDNQSMKISTLLDFLLVYSANDAAHIAALAVTSSEDEFINLMNIKAIDLGMNNTNYTNVHGLDDTSHYTTINDLLLLTLESIKYDPIIASVRKESFIATINNNSPTLYKTTNELVNYNSDYIGLKTGWTSKAGLTLIGLYQNSERNIITIVNKSEVDTNKMNHFFDTQKLVNESIDNYKLINIINKNETLIKIYNGQDNYEIKNTTNIEVFDNIESINTINLDSFNQNEIIYSYHDDKTLIVPIPKTNKISILNKILFWIMR